ncbi:NAD-dependent epimerase/dehydratase family protein [Candidatus Dependentiae bacterium]|nr:NAD-dependent epimerase/dehydratase family protein [Candidatus Dependentiae bacterium]
MNSDILITGAAGFIGSNLTSTLLKKGFKITGLDNFSKYYSRKIKENNLKPLLKNKNFSFINLDLAKNSLVKNIPPSPIVIHLAAQPGVRASWGKSFNIYTRDNIIGMQNILEWSVQNEVERFIFSSSSSIYGDTDILPMDERKSSLNPISPYGSTKLMGENLCYIYKKNFGLNTINLRFFSVYGPGQRPDMAFFRIIRAALTGNEFILFGDGKQTRDFTYVKDIINGIEGALKVNIKKYYTFNLGGGHRVNMNRVIELISTILKKKINIKKINFQKGDVKNTLSRNTLAKKYLDYKPSFSLKDGLKNQIKWLKNNLNILS